MITIAVLVAAISQIEAKRVPHGNDETKFVELKADPEKFLGKEIIICGGAKLDDWYGTDYYYKCKLSHYSVSFREIGPTTADLGEFANLYLPKEWGQEVSQVLIEHAKKNPPAHGLKLARAKVILLPKSFAQSKSWRELELQDIQFANENKDAWQSWLVEPAKKRKEQEDKRREELKRDEEKRRQIAEIERQKALADAKREAEFRVWTDATGEYRVIARLEGFENGEAILERKSDGKTIRVRLALLSKEDQLLIREILKAKREGK